MLANLESEELNELGLPRLALPSDAPRMPADSDTSSEVAAQFNLFKRAIHPVIEILRDTDTDRLTPLEALNLLHEMKRRIEGNNEERP